MHEPDYRRRASVFTVRERRLRLMCFITTRFSKVRCHSFCFFSLVYGYRFYVIIVKGQSHRKILVKILKIFARYGSSVDYVNESKDPKI